MHKPQTFSIETTGTTTTIKQPKIITISRNVNCSRTNLYVHEQHVACIHPNTNKRSISSKRNERKLLNIIVSVFCMSIDSHCWFPYHAHFAINHMYHIHSFILCWVFYAAIATITSQWGKCRRFFFFSHCSIQIHIQMQKNLSRCYEETKKRAQYFCVNGRMCTWNEYFDRPENTKWNDTTDVCGIIFNNIFLPLSMQLTAKFTVTVRLHTHKWGLL